MMNKIRNRKGFTLIELLIVVAIIGILAAVAIPQFSAYRMRGFNSAALSDLKNVTAGQESMNTSFQTYGLTSNANLAAGVAAGAGTVLPGPMSPAAIATTGAALLGFGPDASGTATVIAGSGIGVSNGVRLVANTADLGGTPANVGRTYISYAKHLSGDRQVGAEAEGTAVWACQNATFIGNATGLPATAIATMDATVNFVAGTGCGGSPNTNWMVL